MNHLFESIVWEELPSPEEDGELPYATHEGYLDLGAARLKCYTLNDGRRIFDAEDVERFLGMAS